MAKQKGRRKNSMSHSVSEWWQTIQLKRGHRTCHRVGIKCISYQLWFLKRIWDLRLQASTSRLCYSSQVLILNSKETQQKWAKDSLISNLAHIHLKLSAAATAAMISLNILILLNFQNHQGSLGIELFLVLATDYSIQLNSGETN